MCQITPYKKDCCLQQKCKKTFKLKMEGEQIPKATMTNFLKARLKVSFSAEFANKILVLAKDYINKLTEQANEVCTKNDKKTINAEHIQSALANFGLESQLKQLKDMGSMIKEQNQIKQQFRQRIQQNIEKNLQEVQGDQNEPRVVSIKQNIGHIQIHDDDSDGIDYEAQIEQQSQEKTRKVEKVEKGKKQPIQKGRKKQKIKYQPDSDNSQQSQQ